MLCYNILEQPLYYLFNCMDKKGVEENLEQVKISDDDWA